MYFLGDFLSSDMLSGMYLETCVYKVCEKCRTMTNTRQKQIYHQVVWDMSQQEWNRGKISLKELLRKGTRENIECECDHCQTTTTQLSCTTILESPQQILYINLNRSLNGFDRSVANKAYYVHDQENGRDLITYPVICPRVLQYKIKAWNEERKKVFVKRTDEFHLQGVIQSIIQEDPPSVKYHFDCHCINEEGKWIHYNDYESKDSKLFDRNQDEFESDSVTALFYKRMTNV